VETDRDCQATETRWYWGKRGNATLGTPIVIVERKGGGKEEMGAPYYTILLGNKGEKQQRKNRL